MRVPHAPPDYMSIFNAEPEGMLKILNLKAGPAPGGRYRHWFTQSHVSPPEGITSEQWWAAVKLARLQSYREIPLKDKQSEPFVYGMPDLVLEYLHEIDRQASGNIQASDHITNPQTRDRYIVNSLIEEAITSSQLEGASTTSQVARDMIRSGRKPVDRSERMILNNYRAMQLISGFKGVPLTPELVFEIHQTITQGTLPGEAISPYLREDGDGIAVWDERDNTKLHEPPPAAEITPISR